MGEAAERFGRRKTH